MNLGGVGIVGSGGGFKGVYSMGFIEALYLKGIVPIFGEGVSINALMLAKLVASNWNVLEVKKIWLKVQEMGPSYIFDKGILEMSLNLFRTRSSLSSNRKIVNLLLNNIDFQAIADSPIHFQAVTYNKTRRRQVIFSNKDAKVQQDPKLMATAILASLSPPLLLPPIFMNGEWYSDGKMFRLGNAVRARCDTIFILFNGNLDSDPTDFGSLGIHKQWQAGQMEESIMLIEREIRWAVSRGYDLIENNPSPIFEDIREMPKPKKIRRRLKHFADSVLETVTAGADPEQVFIPHRIILLTVPKPIASLTITDFTGPNPRTKYPGDISLAMEQCSPLPDEFWAKL